MFIRATRRTVLVFALLLVFAETTAQAATIEKWNRDLIDIDGMLKAQRYADARERVMKLTRHMLGNIGVGPDAMYTLGVATSFRALAEAGLGHRTDADWYWHTAVALFPSFHGSDLHIYGAAGAVVMNLDASLGKLPTMPVDRREPVSSERVKPPKVLSRAEPEYPRGLLDKGAADTAVIEVQIGSDGIVSKPRILSTGWAPSFAFATLEALRRWRFTPAMKDETPVECTFTLTMNFRLH